MSRYPGDIQPARRRSQSSVPSALAFLAEAAMSSSRSCGAAPAAVHCPGFVSYPILCLRAWEGRAAFLLLWNSGAWGLVQALSAPHPCSLRRHAACSSPPLRVILKPLTSRHSFFSSPWGVGRCRTSHSSALLPVPFPHCSVEPLDGTGEIAWSSSILWGI